ncbi:zinc-binding dehydrogenase [Geodermatophilus sp. YIM 151500]|uniref:zinc-binding dehydrogenase n=1 Tax=Geodermatophilus sp. YIM 151500 TaxID=2984531 RepID=UPI0021E4C6AE|nr:zinc-binding dehydrogenase [Geodermatophilus sp. YIM 151500]MCV2487791.1 zinc-binding dehydrogenase [Geodermatophilus sp. YIM 151500]
MRAAFVPGPGRVEVGEFPAPVPRREGDVVVGMERASICGSDVHAVHHGFLKPEGVGRPGYPGHEGVGTVLESRSSAFAPGDRVLTVPVVGGCFAEQQLVSEHHLVPLPPDGDPARLLMAQQYGTTLFAMRLFAPAGPVATAAVVGAGSAGLFFLQQLRRLGAARVVVSDRSPARLAVARRLGADVTVLAPGESLVEAVHELTGGVGADLVVEAVGLDATRAEAVAAVRVQGTVGCFGFPERFGDAPFPTYAAYRKSARVLFASGAQGEPGLRAFRDAVEHVAAGRVEVDHCLGSDFPLEEVPEALEAARDLGRGAVKIGIDITGAAR